MTSRRTKELGVGLKKSVRVLRHSHKASIPFEPSNGCLLRILLFFSRPGEAKQEVALGRCFLPLLLPQSLLSRLLTMAALPIQALEILFFVFKVAHELSGCLVEDV